MSHLYNLCTNFRTRFSNALSLFCAVLLSGLFCAPSFGQTYYNMASGNYTEPFTAWAGYGTNWNAVPVNATGTIPSATRTSNISENKKTHKINEEVNRMKDLMKKNL